MNHRTRVLALTALAVVSSGIALRRVSLASDHRDSPSLAFEPGLDIADVYAFMRPAGASPSFTKSNHLVAVMTVHPSAPNNAMFETEVAYVLNIVGLDDPAAGITGALDAAVTCFFHAGATTTDAGLPAQTFTCSANGTFFTGTTNEVKGSTSDALRVFAGLRSDPAFGAVPGVLAAIGEGRVPASDAGPNVFAGANVLSIVAELDVHAVLFGDAGSTPLGVFASTERP